MRIPSTLARAVAATAVVFPATANAAYDVFHVIVPMTFTSDEEQPAPLVAPAHDSVNRGTLSQIGAYIRASGQSGSLDWTVTNNSVNAQNNQTLQVQHHRSLTIDGAPPPALLAGTNNSVSDPFSLAPSASHLYAQLPATVSGGSGATYINNDLPFEIFELGDPVELTLTSGFTATPPASHSITNVTGDLLVHLDVRIAYKYLSEAGPDATPIADGQSIQSGFTNLGYVWHTLDYSGGALQIDTFGSSVQAAGANDTFLALYDDQGHLIGSNDNADGGTGLSQLLFDDGQLADGMYYIFVSGPGVDVAGDTTDFNANPLEMIRTTGTYRLNINIPEPGGLSLLAGVGIMLLRRRNHRR